MTEDRALPTPPVRTVYLDTGEEVAEYTGSDFGEQPDWDKEFLKGKGIIIRGLSTEVFHPEGTAFPPARSVLYNLLTDSPETEPWGMFFSDYGVQPGGIEHQNTSTFIKQVRAEFRKNGGRPFVTDMEYVDSTIHKGQGYWKLKRYIRNASPKEEVSTANRQK